MIGQTLAHCRVLEKIGEGGMGEVYLAEDTKPERQLALKFLPEQLAQNEESLARFDREAKLPAALNHPNIATIHGLEEADGKRFIAYGDGGGRDPGRTAQRRAVGSQTGPRSVSRLPRAWRRPTKKASFIAT